MWTSGFIVFILFAITAAILLFYYIYFFSRLAFYNSKKSRQAQQPLSVIVCAKNEAENLAENVPALMSQAYNGMLETIIVNDHSTDDSENVLQDLKNKFTSIVLIKPDNKNRTVTGKKHPLSAGISAAQHEILLLTDADCMPASNQWVEKMQAGYGNGIDIVLGYGAYQKFPGFLNKVIRFETFHSALQYLSYALAGQTYMGVGRNLSYKKSLFLNNEGFASISHLPGGDDDLFINQVATKTNTAIVIDPDAHTLSKPKKTWTDWKQQKTRHFSTSKYYKTKHKFLLGLYSLLHFLFYPLAAATAIMFDWKPAALILIVKSIIQFFVFSKVMRKLNEADLVKWIFVMDVWMVLYYIFFAPMLFKKESKKW